MARRAVSSKSLDAWDVVDVVVVALVANSDKSSPCAKQLSNAFVVEVLATGDKLLMTFMLLHQYVCLQQANAVSLLFETQSNQK